MAFNPFSALGAKIFGGMAIAALAAAAVQTVRIEGLGPIDGFKERVAELVDDVRTVTAQRDAEAEAHLLTKRTYRAAQDAAAALERQRIALVAAQQEQATNAIIDDYGRRLGAVRAHAEQLRRQLASGGAGVASARGAGAVPSLSAAPGGAADPPGYPRLPRSAAEQLARDVAATEQAAQLDALITFVEAQAAIDPNPHPEN